MKQRDTCIHAVMTTRLETYHVQNDVTIPLSKSCEGKYKRISNKRHQRSASKTRVLAPHDNSWKFKRADLTATRDTPQLRCYQNYKYLNGKAIPGLSKYPGLLVKKNRFQVVENSQKTGFVFGKTRSWKH